MLDQANEELVKEKQTEIDQVDESIDAVTSTKQIDNSTEAEAPDTIIETEEEKAEKPEWLPKNFWDEESGEANYEQLGKSYNELRAEFNRRNNDKVGESVEDYTSEDFLSKVGVKSDDQALVAAIEVASDLGMGVKQTQNFITTYMDKIKDILPTPINSEEELQKLGKNGPHVVAGLKVWIDGLKNKGQLSEDSYNSILDIGKTASGIKALDVLRRQAGFMDIPTSDAITGSSHMSAEDWYAATYETHKEPGESKSSYDVRMREIGKTIFGEGRGSFSGSGYGVGSR